MDGHIHDDDDWEVSADVVATQGPAFWYSFKEKHKLDLSACAQREANLYLINIPTSAHKKIGNSEFTLLHTTLAEARRSYVFGNFRASIALLRASIETALFMFYDANGKDLDEKIDSVERKLPGRASAQRLHRMRKGANRILHPYSSLKENPKIENSQDSVEKLNLEMLQVFQILIEKD